MPHAINSLNPLAVIVVSIIGFVIGALWFSPLLFVKAWMAEMKLNPEECKARGGAAQKMIAAFVLMLVSTTVLAVLISSLQATDAIHGAKVGLFVGIGLVAVREATHALFESRSCRHFLITAGHDVVLLAVQGAILAVWR